MSDVAASPLHPAALAHLLAQRGLKASDDAQQWLRLLFVEGFHKVVRAARSARATEPATSAPVAVVDAAVAALLPPQSPLAGAAGAAARDAVARSGDDLLSPPGDLVVPPGRTRAALVEGGGASPWSDAPVPAVQEAAVAISAALQSLYDAFLVAVAAAVVAAPAGASTATPPQTDASPLAAAAAGVDVRDSHISSAIDARPELAALFQSRAADKKHAILKVNIVRQDANNVLKTVKVDLGAPVRNVIDYLRGKWLNARPDDRFCLFLPTDETDESEGYFLDPQRTWHSYPAVNESTVIEFHKLNRSLTVFVDDKRSVVVEIEETYPIEQIVRLVTSKIGIQDPSRYGLLLLGPQQEVRQRREELEGVHSSVAASAAGPSASSSTLAMPTISLSAGSMPTAGEVPVSGAAGTQSAGMHRQRSVRRPVSQMFVNVGDGIARTRRAVNDVPAMTGPQPFKASRANIVMDEIEFVQTKDQTEWLRPQQTLRGIDFDRHDSLLLVRLEKILGFEERLLENPLKLCEELLENAEELLQGLHRVEGDLDAFLASRTPDAWVSPCDYRATRQGELTLSKGDVVDVVLRDGMRWQGVVSGVVGWLEPSAVTQWAQWQSLQESLNATMSTASGRAEGASHASSATSAGIALIRKATLSRKTAVDRHDSGSGSDREVSFAASSVSLPDLTKERAGSTALVPPAMRSGLGSESRISMQGYLLKKGRTFDQWKRKYYVLRSHCFWYYATERDEKLLGQFSVLGADVAVVNKHKGRTFVFSVLCNGVLRYLSAPSQEDLTRWVAALKHEVQRD